MQDAHFKKITAYISTRVNFLIFRESERLWRKDAQICLMLLSLWAKRLWPI